MTTDAVAHADMAPVLTKSQQRVLDAIRAYILEHGYPPSRGCIQRAMGFKSPNAVTYQVRVLVAKGALEIDAGVSRGMRVK